MKSLIKKFSEVGIKDVSSVGGKNASLGEMYNELTSKGVRIPNGFATTSFAFWEFLKENNIQTQLENILKKLDRTIYSNLEEIGKEARSLILSSTFSEAFSEEIIKAYSTLCEKDKIKSAFERSADIKAKNIRVEVDGHTVTLRGIVHSLAEKDEARKAAYKAPGVYNVKNELKIEYYPAYA